jgi:hypothetical protein
MRSNIVILKAIYVVWLVLAWFAFIPAAMSGANLLSVAAVMLGAYSFLVVGLVIGNKIAWLASPLPAVIVALFGIPWFVNNLATAFGFEWYHDSPALPVTLLVGVAFPGAALVALGLLWRNRGKVVSLFRNEPKAI